MIACSRIARTGESEGDDSRGSRTKGSLRGDEGSPPQSNSQTNAAAAAATGSPGERDDAGRHQRIDLTRFHSQLAEDFLRVLTERRRRAAHADVERRATNGKPEHLDAAAPRLVDLG